MTTASQLIHQSLGYPSGQWQKYPYDGICGTCAAPISEGVPFKSIVSSTFSQHGDYIRYGDHACPACAWLYSYPKQTHRGVLAVQGHCYWPMISIDNATEDRPSWFDVLRKAASFHGDTLVAGVLTTDPKPRFWPRAELRTREKFGLYIHASDYDVSSFINFDLDSCITIQDKIILPALSLGFAKSSCYFGLFSDYKRSSKNLEETRRLELALTLVRQSPEFIPALLTSGVSKK